MISDEHGALDDAPAGGVPWRRGLDVLDDYSGGGMLSEELADDLVNELVGLGARTRRPRRSPHPATRPGPQPSRPPVRPRLVLVRGGLS